MTPMTPGKYLGLKRIADANGRFKMLAVDQRPPIENLVAEGRGSGEPSFEDVVRVKMSLLHHLGGAASAVLLDPQYVYPQGLAEVSREKGLLVTLEYDKFEESPGGRLSHPIPDWSVGKIRMSGGDAVKVLAWYRPDAAPDVLEHQQAFVSEIGAECNRMDIPFVLELLVYPLSGESQQTDYSEYPEKRVDHVLDSVETFAHASYFVDLFKLESPVPISAFSTGAELTDRTLAEAFSNLGRAAGRPWVMLSAGADQRSFETILEHAYDAGASGYLAGRAIWWDACVSCFPDWEAMDDMLEDQALPYMEGLNRLTDEQATPWFDHTSFGEEGPALPHAGLEFRAEYGTVSE